MEVLEEFFDWLDSCPVLWRKKYGEYTYYFDIEEEEQDVWT